MEAYMQRVIKERDELVEKLNRLTKFVLSNPVPDKLSNEDRFLLQTQYEIMRAYREILDRRIEKYDRKTETTKAIESKLQRLNEECSALSRQVTGLFSYLAKEDAERQSGQSNAPNRALKYSYRKKPVVVEAFQMTRERMDDNNGWPEWLHKAWQLNCHTCGSVGPMPGRDKFYINTLEGVYFVSPNDYIIRGVKGELYPCKQDTFEATYEPLDEALNQRLLSEALQQQMKTGAIS
jgi:hypothetical protein